MPSPRPARPIRREGLCRSTLRRKRNSAWLQKRLVEEISGIADMIAFKRAEGAAEMAGVYQGGRPHAGPASREDACDDGANTPSMPR